MGAAAAPLMIGATVLQTASQVKQGIDQSQEASYAGREAEHEAAQSHMEASGKIISDDYNAMNILNRISANAAASGTTGGSTKQVFANSAEEARINDMYTRYNGKLAATADIFAGKQQAYAASSEAASSFLGAGMTALSGGFKGYKLAKYGDNASLST